MGEILTGERIFSTGYSALTGNDSYCQILCYNEFDNDSINLIKRALNSEYILSDPIVFSDLRSNSKMCENLELFYRTRHLGEFKKSKFAKIIADNIKYKTDISPEITNIISMIY